ncbi:bifunctional folylpolyglutamate synthase/dihydrofolate synthase [Gloeomargarita lithophora]|uniref:bifunctional folylpolyglutamate synthase/dihydrofolate synthase n=1 Tax=Gloeomargarita lithophora TaxID=1188228 RepID=UPI003F6EAB57
MTEPEIYLFFQQLQRFGITLGLERIERLLTHLGQPQNQVPVIHVTGTNGKGSVCAYLASILTACGYRTGLYISPHLIHYQERIQIDGKPIQIADWWRILGQIKQVVASDSIPVTEFEVITALMWLYFVEIKVDIAVIEVGLGGRLDATNVISNPLITVITSIGLDHQERLGSELTDIAREKAGILKPYRPLVRGLVSPPAAQVIDTQAHALNCPVITIEPPIHAKQLLHFQGHDYRIPLAGAHQFLNAEIALEAITELRKQGWNLPIDKVQKGIANTRWPGRLQWVHWQGKKILLDGAHNPEAAQILRQYIDQQNLKPVHWILGLLQTKDAVAVLKNLLHPGDRVSFVPIPGHNYHEPSRLCHLATHHCPGIVAHAEVNVSDVCGVISEQYTPVICGSLYLIGQVLQSITTTTVP